MTWGGHGGGLGLVGYLDRFGGTGIGIMCTAEERLHESTDGVHGLKTSRVLGPIQILYIREII
jgi:hypothetical protein